MYKSLPFLLIAFLMMSIPTKSTFANEYKHGDSNCRVVHELMMENLFLDMTKELKLQDADILKLNKIRADRNNLVRETKMNLENEKNNLGHALISYYPASKDKTQNSTDYINGQVQKIEKLKASIIETKTNSMVEAFKVLANTKSGVDYRSVVLRLSGMHDSKDLEKCLADRL